LGQPQALALVLIEDEQGLALVPGPQALALVLIEEEEGLALAPRGAGQELGLEEGSVQLGEAGRGGQRQAAELAWLPARGSREVFVVQPGHRLGWPVWRQREHLVEAI
jgi:hypothetical protein